MNDKLFLKIDEAAGLLNAPESTVYFWVKKRGLPFIKIGKTLTFDREAIIEWMRAKQKSNPVEGAEDGNEQRQ